MFSFSVEGVICTYRRLDGSGNDCEYEKAHPDRSVETVFICYNGLNGSDGHYWGMRVARCSDMGKYLDEHSLLNPQLSFWNTKKYQKSSSKQRNLLQTKRSLSE